MIRRFGILNDQIKPGDLILHGIPYPGAYMTDADGVVVAKSFHGSYKIRDSPEALIDGALGRGALADPSAPLGVEARAPGAETGAAPPGDDGVRIEVGLRGERGTIRQGIVRHLVARFALADGLHLYGEPVPEGLTATRVSVEGPPGLALHAAITPPTEPLHLPALDLDLPVWSGRFEIVVPFHATGELASECRPLDVPSVELTVHVDFQACDDQECLLPQRRSFTLEVPLEVVDVPKLGMHTGHGQREGDYDGTPHLRRLLARKFRESPLGFARHLLLAIRLNLAAAWRRLRGARAAR